MRRNGHYTHPRFLDATFVVKSVGFYGGRWKVKLAWYVRGNSVGVTTKHELTRAKALEFTEVNK